VDTDRRVKREIIAFSTGLIAGAAVVAAWPGRAVKAPEPGTADASGSASARVAERLPLRDTPVVVVTRVQPTNSELSEPPTTGISERRSKKRHEHEEDKHGRKTGANQATNGQPAQAAASTNLQPLTVDEMRTQLQGALQQYADMGDKDVRDAWIDYSATFAKVGLPSEEIADALGRMFEQERSTELKVTILEELGGLQGPAAFDKILLGLNVTQPSEAREAAVSALGDLRDPRALSVLRELLQDRDVQGPRRGAGRA